MGFRSVIHPPRDLVSQLHWELPGLCGLLSLAGICWSRSPLTQLMTACNTPSWNTELRDPSARGGATSPTPGVSWAPPVLRPHVDADLPRSPLGFGLCLLGVHCAPSSVGYGRLRGVVMPSARRVFTVTFSRTGTLPYAFRPEREPYGGSLSIYEVQGQVALGQTGGCSAKLSR